MGTIVNLNLKGRLGRRSTLAVISIILGFHSICGLDADSLVRCICFCRISIIYILRKLHSRDPHLYIGLSTPYADSGEYSSNTHTLRKRAHRLQVHFQYTLRISHVTSSRNSNFTETPPQIEKKLLGFVETLSSARPPSPHITAASQPIFLGVGARQLPTYMPPSASCTKTDYYPAN
jgi:hypothetical protein